MSKKILVIGAGIAQADAIWKARQLGYYVMASDGSPDAPGLGIAAESRVIDVTDVGHNLEWARSANIDGVLSYASDIALPTVQGIREELGLVGLAGNPMRLSLDKSKQRECIRNADLPQPDYATVDDYGSYCDVIDVFDLPVVVKPVDNAGSRGVSIVNRKKDLKRAYQEAISNSKKRRVIVEEYLKGVELTIEGFSVAGEHHVLAISSKYKPEGSYRVATELVYPGEIPESVEAEVSELMCSTYRAMGIDNAPTHSEVILTKEGPKIVEVGCRGGGYFVFSRVVEYASSYKIVENWTRLCAGDEVDKVEVKKRGVVLRFFTAPPGRLVGVNGLERACDVEGVEVGMFLKPGDVIPELKNDGSRTGWMIVQSDDRAMALSKAKMVTDMISFEVEDA